MHDWREQEALFRYAVIREAASERLTPTRSSGRSPASSTPTRGGAPRARALDDRPLDPRLPPRRLRGAQAPRAGARTAAVLLEQAAELRREAPERTAAQIAEILHRLHAERAPSARTVRHHLARLGLVRQDLAGPGRFGRFEAERPNELWVADALHGPTVEVVLGRGRRAILFCLLDDHSRLVVLARFTYTLQEQDHVGNARHRG
jgi:putative transposase